MDFQRRHLCGAAGAALALLPLRHALAQAYPQGPIKLIVPTPAGGGTDITGRFLATELSRILGQPVVVENQPGANAMIGTRMVAKAPPDGYTLLLASGEMSVNPHLYKKIAYDSEKEITPVSLMVKVPNIMVINTDVPAKDLASFIEYAKKTSDKLSYSSSGIGNVQHLGCELFCKMIGVHFDHVPYKGAAPQLADVAGKHITMTLSSIGAALPFIQGGKVRPIAVSSAHRVDTFPDLPTLSEHPALAGYEIVNYFGLFATGGTPAPIIKRLNDAVQQSFAMPEFGRQFTKLGFEPAPNSPEAFRQYVRDESRKYGKIISDVNITAE